MIIKSHRITVLIFLYSFIHRIIPDCIKKNGTNKKQQEHIENIKFTDTSMNTLPDTKTDDQTIVGSDRKDLQITQATKISLGNRKSWTYGSRIERNSCDKDIKDFKHFDIMEDKENVEEGEALNRVIELDSLQRVRELQREHSFPGCRNFRVDSFHTYDWSFVITNPVCTLRNAQSHFAQYST